MWKSMRLRVLLDRMGKANREKKEREDRSSRAVEVSLLPESATICAELTMHGSWRRGGLVVPVPCRTELIGGFQPGWCLSSGFGQDKEFCWVVVDCAVVQAVETSRERQKTRRGGDKWSLAMV